MSKPNLLFAPETFNIAETTRMIEIAKVAQQDFTIHFMGYGGKFVDLITEAGFTFHHLEPNYTQAKINYLWKIDRMEGFGEPFTADEVRQRVASELALYQVLRPAAVVIGFTLTVYVSARIGGLPLVAVTPFAFTRPFFEAGLGKFPDQFRRGPIRWLPTRWLDKAFSRWALRTRAWTKHFNIILQEHGCKPFETLMESWEADHMLIAEIPMVTGVPDLPPNWHYIGPIFAHLPGDVPDEVKAVSDKHPLIYCSMGSSGNQVVVQRVIEAFDNTHYQVISPVKAHIAGTSTIIPANVLVTDWLPAPKVNPLADIAVIHGGHGTVQTACASGTPFVGIGMQPEQEWNIDFLVRRGCAIRLSRHEVTRQDIIQAVEQLLNNQHAQAVAKEVQSEYQQWNGAERTAQFLASHFK